MMTLFSTVLAAPQNAAGAGSINLKPEGSLTGSLTGLTLSSLVGFAINAVLIVSAIIFFFMLIFGGLQWIISGGDKANTEAARGRVTAAIVGLVIVFSAWVIASLIGSIFNIDIFNLNFGTVNSF